MPLKKEKHKVIIIGAGPAGIACAVQLKRSGLKPVIIEKESPGGLLHQASRVENYPGFPHGIKASELIQRLGQHLEEYDIPVIYEEVKEASFANDSFQLVTDRGSLSAEVLVIATGTSPTSPDIQIPNSETGARVLNSIVKIKKLSGLHISIVGAGDAAFDYALSMASQNTVSIYCRNDSIKALHLLQERLAANQNITIHNFHQILSVEWDRVKGCLQCHYIVNKTTRAHLCDYLIFATGRKPALGFIHPTLQVQFKTLEKRGLLYLVGDVRGSRYRQAVIAAGEGIRAAMKIANESYQ